MMAKVANAIMFQLGWWICVLGAAKGWPLVGPLVAVVLLAAHFACQKTPPWEWKIILVGTVGGFFIDSMLRVVGVLDFGGALFAPPWLVALWALLAMTINHSISWLSRNLTGASLFGFLGGPLAYYGGAQLGALAVHGWADWALLAVVWAVIVPLLFEANHRLATKDVSL